MQHHEDTLDGFVAAAARKSETLGVVLVGSVARRTPRPDSDVDVYLVVTDAAYARARGAGAIAFVSHDGVTYPGGYVDVKLASPGYLRAAVARADDSTRASFIGARVCLDRAGDLTGLIEGIVSLPEEVWADRIRTYRAQTDLYGRYFLAHGDRHGDAFLRQHAGVHLALAAGRIALARNRRFFSGAKYVTATLAELELPDRFRAAWLAVADGPSEDSGAELLAALTDWLGPPESPDARLSRFIADNELAWLHETIPPEFW